MHSIGSMVSAAMAIALTWCLVGLGFVGIGLAVARGFGVTAIDARRCGMAFWTGFVLVLLFLQLWNFAFPVGEPTLALVLAAGAGGLIRCRRELRGWLGAIAWRRERLRLLGLAMVVLWVANQASGPATQHDSGLYHTQAVRWAATYPVVPGLAHLHGRLAFNNASLLYAALLDVGPWSGRASHLANGLLVSALLVQALGGGFGLGAASRRDRAARFFALLVVPPLVVSAMGEDVRSFATDLSLAAVLFAASVRLYASLVAPDPDPRAERYDLIWVAWMLAAAVCIKLSAAVFAALAWGLVLVSWWRGRERAPGPRHATVWLVAVPLALGATWLARGAILSGYPAYPVAVAGLPVDWRVPAEQAVAERAWIAHAARYFYTGLGVGWDWLEPWLRQRVGSYYNHVRVLLPLGLVVGALLALLLPARRRPESSRGGGSGWLLVVPAAGALVSWFFTAPSTRFAFPLIWILAATCVAEVWRSRVLGEKTAPALAVALALTPLLLPAARLVLDARGRSLPELLRAYSHAVVTRPGPDRGLHPMSRPALRPYVTASGLVLAVPSDGARCWDAPLPCTPHPAPNLRLRRPGDLGSGFATDGRWLAADWPNPESRFLALHRCLERARSRGGSPRECVAAPTAAAVTD